MAIPQVAVGLLFGAIALLHLCLMFFAASLLGPLVMWFLRPQPPFLPSLCGVLFLAILFASAAQADQTYWSTFTYDSKSLGEIPVSEAPMVIHSINWYNPILAGFGLPPLRGTGLPADMQVLGPSSLHLMTKLVSLPLLVGPALLFAAFRSIREGCHLIAADSDHMGQILWFVFSRGGRDSFDALGTAIPNFALASDLPILSRIDGVVILHKQMQGIALADRLKEKIQTLAEPAR